MAFGFLQGFIPKLPKLWTLDSKTLNSEPGFRVQGSGFSGVGFRV